MQKIRKFSIFIYCIAFLLIVVGIFLYFQGLKEDKTLKYENIGLLENHLYAVSDGKNIGYIDISGKKVIPLEYSFHQTYSDLEYYQERFGFIPFVENNQFGLLNEKGKEIIKPKYQFLKILSSNSFLVLENDQYFIIDQNEKKLTPTYLGVQTRDNSSCLIANKEENYLLSSQGEVLWQGEESIFPIVSIEENKTYYAVELGDRVSIFSEQDDGGLLNITMPFKTADIRINNNIIYYFEDNNTRLYNFDGNLLDSYPVFLLEPFQNDVSIYIENGKVGLIHRTNGKIIDPIYSNSWYRLFENGYVALSREENGNQLYTLLDPNGKELFSLQEDTILSMIGDEYIVFLNQQNEVEIKTMEMKLVNKYHGFYYLKDQLYVVSNNDRLGVIDKNLKEIVPIQYDDITYHNNQFYLKSDGYYRIQTYQDEK